MVRILSCLCGFFVTAAASAQDGAAPAAAALAGPTPEHTASLPWRNLGPANMGGRITDIEVVPDRRTTWYVATGGGGLWKTTNGGTTWKPLFQDQATVSIGDVAVAPSNPDVVWVGTGEENARNSVQWGNGVYRSTDAGETFHHVGLTETFQIGHIAVHPADADVVYVAALGRLWGHNPDRGVYRTRDGGETWERVLYVDDRTGCVDVRVDPENPDIVYACMYERMRDGFDSNDPAVRFGEKAGFYKSTDGGDSWQRIDAGLPKPKWGRSGLSIYAKNPATLYMIVETERSGWATGSERLADVERAGNAYMGVNGKDASGGGAELSTVTADGPSDQAGLAVGDVVLRVGERDIASYSELIGVIRESQGGETVEVTYRRGEEQRTASLTFGTRRGAGGARRGNAAPFGGRLGGQQPNIQDQQGADGHETGGVFRSDDRGETWKRVNSLTDRPFYYSKIAVDPQDDRNVYSCGVSFYASFDGGERFEPVHRQIHVDFHAIWVDPQDSDHLLLGGDGGLYETWDRTRHWRHVGNFPIGQFYHVDVDAAVPYNVYGGLQDNGTWGGPSRNRWVEGISRDEWVTIYGGDGFGAAVDPEDPNTVYATSQNGGIGRVDMQRASVGRVAKPDDAGGWNWDTPFFLSPHNSRILYFAGGRACRSLDQGRHSTSISPRLGLTERGTATAFAESPRVAGLLYVGTDDGALWRTSNGGVDWEELHANVIGMPGPRYVSSIRPSAHEDDRVYVTFEGHRSDDFATHVYVSEDRGKSWKPLRGAGRAGAIENEPAHVVLEDRRNPNLLFLGTEFGCYASLDRGEQWLPLGDGLPTTAVRDLVVQEREGDLVAATHGRGIWVLDVTPLRQMTPEVIGADVHLFAPEDAILWNMRSRVLLGDEEWLGENPPYGATIHLWTRDDVPEDAQVTVHDVTGEVVAALDVEGRGLHVLQWNVRTGSGRRVRTAEPGNYSVRYRHGERELVQPLVLRPDPDGAVTPLSAPLPTPAARN